MHDGRALRGVISRPDGAEIFADSHGPEDAPTILILDGIGCAGWAFRRIIPRLEGRFRVIETHYRGHGSSPTPPRPWRLSMPVLADDAEAVLTELGVKRATVVGFSMGFQVALELYRRYPLRVEGLASVAGAAGKVLHSFQGTDVFAQALPLIRTATRLAGGWTQELWSRVLPSELSHLVGMRTQVNSKRINAQDLRAYMREMAEMDPELFLAMLEEANRHTAEDLLTRVDVPALVIAGQQDRFVPLASLREIAFSLPSARWEVVPEATHALPAEFPEEVSDQLARFVAEEVAGP